MGKVLARSIKGYTNQLDLGKRIIKEYRDYFVEPEKRNYNRESKPITLEGFMRKFRLYQMELDANLPAKIMRAGTVWKMLNKIPELKSEITMLLLKGGV